MEGARAHHVLGQPQPHRHVARGRPHRDVAALRAHSADRAPLRVAPGGVEGGIGSHPGIGAVRGIPEHGRDSRVLLGHEGPAAHRRVLDGVERDGVHLAAGLERVEVDVVHVVVDVGDAPRVEPLLEIAIDPRRRIARRSR